MGMEPLFDVSRPRSIRTYGGNDPNSVPEVEEVFQTTYSGSPIETFPTGIPPQAPRLSNAKYRELFFSLVEGTDPSSETLVQFESILRTHGIIVLRNAEGLAGKIRLPDGTVVDVIIGVTRGGDEWWWEDLGIV